MKSSKLMRYSWERCTSSDELHDDILVKDSSGDPDFWHCIICGRNKGVMKVQ